MAEPQTADDLAAQLHVGLVDRARVAGLLQAASDRSTSGIPGVLQALPALVSLHERKALDPDTTASVADLLARPGRLYDDPARARALASTVASAADSPPPKDAVGVAFGASGQRVATPITDPAGALGRSQREDLGPAPADHPGPMEVTEPMGGSSIFAPASEASAQALRGHHPVSLGKGPVRWVPSTPRPVQDAQRAFTDAALPGELLPGATTHPAFTPGDHVVIHAPAGYTRQVQGLGQDLVNRGLPVQVRNLAGGDPTELYSFLHHDGTTTAAHTGVWVTANPGAPADTVQRVWDLAAGHAKRLDYPVTRIAYTHGATGPSGSVPAYEHHIVDDAARRAVVRGNAWSLDERNSAQVWVSAAQAPTSASPAVLGKAPLVIEPSSGRFGDAVLNGEARLVTANPDAKVTRPTRGLETVRVDGRRLTHVAVAVPGDAMPVVAHADDASAIASRFPEAGPVTMAVVNGHELELTPPRNVDGSPDTVTANAAREALTRLGVRSGMVSIR
jgi:hypothetical protein